VTRLIPGELIKFSCQIVQAIQGNSPVGSLGIAHTGATILELTAGFDYRHEILISGYRVSIEKGDGRHMNVESPVVFTVFDAVRFKVRYDNAPGREPSIAGASSCLGNVSYALNHIGRRFA
jgi:hypothetical protein